MKKGPDKKFVNLFIGNLPWQNVHISRCYRVGPVRHEMAAAMEMAETGTVAAATGRQAATEVAMGAREAAATEAAVAEAAAAISTWDLAETSGPGEDLAGREGRVVRAGPVVQEGPVVRAAAAAAEKT